MKPLRKLKLAIEAVIDPTFKDDGVGMVGADSETLAISIKNNDNATATLLLKSTGTNRLYFEFRTVPPTGFWAEIVVTPHVTSATTLPVDDLKETIDHTLQAQDPSNDTVFNEIGSDKGQNELEEQMGLEQGQVYLQARFNWRYIRLMKEASFLADRVSMHLLAIPEQHVLFQFHTGELADLLLIKKCLLVVPDISVEEDAPDEDVSERIPLDTVSIS